MPEITEKTELSDVQKLDSGLEAMNRNLDETESSPDISPSEIDDVMKDFEATIDSRLNMSETKENFDTQTDGVNAHDTQTDGKIIQSNATTNHAQPSFGYTSCEKLCRTTVTKVGYNA